MTKRQSDASIGTLAKPRITLTAADYDRLSGLASAAMHNMPEVAITLADELDRAHVLKTGAASTRRRMHGVRGRVPG